MSPGAIASDQAADHIGGYLIAAHALHQVRYATVRRVVNAACDSRGVTAGPDVPVCRRCGRPVRVSREQYETFEQMHYVCFHYEFEHDLHDADADPDEDCGVPGCPSAAFSRHRDQTVAVLRQLVEDWSDGPPANWENQSVPEYLEALGGWLEEFEASYRNRGVPVPWNSWQVMRDALRAATIYE